MSYNTLSTAKQALLQQRLRGKPTMSAEPPSIPRRSERHLAPLSFGQSRLWFLDQWEPGSALYSIPRAFALSGALDITALERALTLLAERHESLRTSFRLSDGAPVQVIGAAGHLPVQLIDLQHLPQAERQAAAHLLAADIARQPFDLETGPLVRATLLRVGQQEHIFLLEMHHIISDGWSLGVFVRELAAYYDAQQQGTPALLPELPIQYADFACWQRQRLDGEWLERQLAYWRRQLGGAPTSLELPTDRPRPPVQSHHGAGQSFSIPEALTAALNHLGRQAGATLFMTLLAAFQALLARYTGQDDIVVGAPVANRTHVQLESLIGFFVNTLALRTDFSGNPTFRELLGRVRETALGAYAHQDVPFERIVEELQPERNLNHQPLFQVMFVLQNTPPAMLELRGVTARSFGDESATAKFDLVLAIEETAQGLAGHLRYKTDLFDAPTIARMAGHLRTLLQAIVANPDLPIARLPLLTDAERQQLLAGWNATQASYPADRCLHQLFEAHAARTPDAVAIVYDQQRITYGELNARANQLAHHLRGLGVGAEQVVGVCMARSPELVLGMLGILKAGGAFLPLDPATPHERIAFMLSDAAAALLLTQAQVCTRLAELPAAVICVDADWGVIATEPSTDPNEQATSANLAYVIYTSGSTGVPKGVQIEHRSVANLIDWHRRAFAITPSDRATQLAGVAFDAAVWELWPYLATGASVYIPDDETRAEPARLRDWLVAQSITIGFVPTPVAERLLALEWPEHCALRVLLTGGDTLQRYPTAALPYALINNYGPTENTVVTTSGRILPQAQAGVLPNIGRPIANTQVYILDRQLQPAPIGVPGELYIGGDSLARGYLNRPELSAERFVPNPFVTTGEQQATTPSRWSPAGGSRLYKTGDLARWRPDRTIEFLGRNDQQVKIRGFRIEPGEVAAVLSEHPAVGECVVVANEDLSGAKQLVAYIVFMARDAGSAIGQEPQPPIAELRAFLKQRLPDYMIPAMFVVLDVLPLTLNGKVDRRALPAPTQARGSAAMRAMPRTATERALAAIWGDVLRVEAIGLDDNFFDLGGHSLLAAQLIARVRQELHVALPLRSLFETPTVAGLAEKIQPALAAAQTPPIVPASRDGALPLAYGQERLWFLEQFSPGSAAYTIPIGVRLQGPLDSAALARSLQALVQRHEPLRTSFTSSGGRPIQRIAAHLEIDLPVIDLRHLPSHERAAHAKLLADEQARCPFDLHEAPLMRARLLRLDEQEHQLILTIHHIIFDGWSQAIFFHELSALYAADVQGQICRLSALPVQSADVAIWQRQHSQGEAFDQGIDYWKALLAAAPPGLELPTDRPRPPIQRFRGARQPLTLGKPLTDRLKLLADQERATLFMALLAAFNVLLYRYSGQADILIGTPIANRPRAETAGLIGFFANTLVLRTDLSGNPSYRTLLQRVREIAIEAYAHQDTPFERLVEVLQPERDPSRAVLFQAMVAFQAEAPATLTLPGLAVEPLELESGTAKFDLTLSLRDAGDGLRGWIEYDSDLFDATTIARMANHLTRLLEGIAADPDQPIRALPLLGSAERNLLLQRWNATTQEFPRDRCIHQLFEAQAARTPAALALICGEARLTYQQLDRRANQLAHYLQRLGIGPGARVGICLERTPDLVVGLLGILKAGAAYVPLDPAYPHQRLAFMLDDAQASALLTKPSTYAASADTSETQMIVNIELAHDSIAAMPATRPTSQVTADDLAYLIYTSGSTGRPKGVEICHSNTVNLVEWAREAFSAEELAGVLAGTSICFDLSAFELFVPLAWGGTVILAEHVLALATLPAAQRVTLINTVPSAMAELLRLGPLPASVRTVNLAGEPLPQTLAQHIYTQSAASRVVNLYGPTETTTYSSFAVVPHDLQAEPTIGRPLANTQIYILDQDLQPAPIGIPGELYIGGAGLARGYHNRPELTVERFIPDPFGNAAARLYRTGDLARWKPDGNIEYLGRADHQVKLRGFRIELGEIAATLLQHPAVREAVAVVREDAPGDKRLVAYVAPAARAGDAPQPPTFLAQPLMVVLRDFLKQRLPDYMIPAAFVVLDTLPLTLNGKVDRRALPAPAARIDTSYQAPRAGLEQALAEIWAQVLRVDRIGAHDNFFALGGDSLLSMQIVSRANQAGVPLTVKHMFQHQTIAEQAAAVAAQPGAAGEQGLVVGQVPLTPNQHWFFEQRLPDPQHWNLATMLETPPELNLARLERATQHVLLHHDALRLRFIQDQAGWRQLIAPPDQATPVARVDLSTLPDELQGPLIKTTTAEAQASLSLSDGPLVRVIWFDRGARRPGRLLVIMHHLAGDKLSFDIVLEDLQTAYGQLSRGEQPQLPQKTTSFKQWAERLGQQAGLLGRSDLADLLELPWAAVAALPVDYPDGRCANIEASAETVAVSLGAEATRALLLQVPSAYDAQLIEVLLSALAYALGRWAGSPVLVIEGASHGRAPIFDGVDVSRTVGWLAVHPLILLDVRGADTPQMALQSNKAQLRQIANSGIGQDILRYLSDDPAIRAQMQALPEPEVFFSFVGRPSPMSHTLFRQIDEDAGPQHSPSSMRSRLLECAASIADEQLQLVWRYSANVHRRSTITSLAHSYLAVLQSLIPNSDTEL